MFFFLYPKFIEKPCIEKVKWSSKVKKLENAQLTILLGSELKLFKPTENALEYRRFKFNE